MPDLALNILVAVGVASAITLLLALLLIVADATIADYGSVTITVNDDRNLTVEGGTSLLSALNSAEVFVPSACGGRGSCGLCKARVVSGAGDLLPTELPWLNARERADGVRLCCQVKVKRDIALVLPKGLLGVRRYVADVVALRDLTYDIKEVTLSLLEPSAMAFTAGQYVQFEVPEYELTREPVYRAYSIASDPADGKTIRLQVRLVPNGICTTYVHRHLALGDRVAVNGPHGEFRLHDTGREIIFIAGGSGMAPIRAMLFDMARTNSPRAATYYFGAKSARDLFLVDEMRSFEARLPRFRFVPALSSPSPDDRWDGQTGLITDVVERNVTSGADAEAYLCGSPGMIDAAIKSLIKRGVPEDRIFYDKFA
jgi:Na+-transporting NADH:ubiquinone oxidoreductase subunit F